MDADEALFLLPNIRPLQVTFPTLANSWIPLHCHHHRQQTHPMRFDPTIHCLVLLSPVGLLKHHCPICMTTKNSEIYHQQYTVFNKNWTSTGADTIPLSLQHFIQNVVGLAWWCSTRSFTLCLALLRRIFTRNLLLKPDCAPTVQNPERLHSHVPELMTTLSQSPLLWSEILEE